ncbi:hypothetical protein INT80_14350 [Gallibacterium anatis]|uniref:Uncharacterized protein n=1 Tax=Gallibacterium anatis TaxID=750 RepID=A0A930UTL3_9PAST|nr:hypothetical protein [Gallibacterium anatis]
MRWWLWQKSDSVPYNVFPAMMMSKNAYIVVNWLIFLPKSYVLCRIKRGGALRNAVTDNGICVMHCVYRKDSAKTGK